MLAIAGYSVSSPREPLDAILLLQHDEYLAVLIGHSVLQEEAAAIAAKAQSLRVSTIFVYRGNPEIPKWADLAVDDQETAKLLKYLDQVGAESA